MVSFLRLIVALVLLSLSAAASAQSYPYLKKEYKHEEGTSWHADPTSACASFVPTPTNGTLSFETLGNPTSDPPFCWYSYTSNGTTVSKHTYRSLEIRRSCPWGTISQGGQCVVNKACPSGYPRNSSGQCTCGGGDLFDETTGQCKSDDDEQCRTFYAIGGTLGGFRTQERSLTGKVPSGSRYCMEGQFPGQNKGCIVEFEAQASYSYGDGNYVSDGFFDKPQGLDSGLSCTPGEGGTPAPPAENKCPGGYPGSVNGVEVCVDKVPDSGFEPGSDETTVDDGENTTTNRTNSETKCENGRCTTTTTVTTTVTNNATGATTTTSSTTTTTQSQESFCKANPKAKLCGGSGLPNIDGGGSGGGGNGEKDPSSFTGACAGGFQCKGDAIQCAIAREQHIRACRLFDKESPESKLYEEFKGKEGDQTKDLPGNETIAIGDKINSSDALGAGGAGLSDLSLTVWNQQVTLPLSMLNKYLAAMGNVLLAVSFLLAFRIVARG